MDYTELDSLRDQYLSEIEACETTDALEAVHKKFFGKSGSVSALSKRLKDMSEKDKKTYGMKMTDVRAACESSFNEKQKEIAEASIRDRIRNEKTDMRIPMGPVVRKVGTYHPLTLTTRVLTRVAERIGFAVLDGYEIETDKMNFESLNIDRHHPARDEHDTFYMRDPKTGGRHESLLLRTHTSPGQIRSLLRFGAPIRAVIPGKTFRNEATDDEHDHTFHQLEGLFVDENVTVAHLFGTVDRFLKELFGPDVTYRIRPNHFPFVEPGFEVDMKYVNKKGENAWMEMLGCGMVHPDVLRAGGVDPEKYSGFAFGFGITRMCMVRFGVADIRRLLSGEALDVSVKLV